MPAKIIREERRIKIFRCFMIINIFEEDKKLE